MPVAAGEAFIPVRPDVSGFRKELEQGVTPAVRGVGDRVAGALGGASERMKTVGNRMTVGITAPLVLFGKGAVSAASDLEESTSKVRTVFGDIGDEMLAWSEDAATSMGISKAAALEALGTYGNLLTAMGITPEVAGDMSTKFVELASDLASFNNASPEETLNALRAGLTGETEPLKRFGINLNAARIEAEAFAMGLAKPTVNAAKLQTAQVNVEKATRGLAEAQREHGEGSLEAEDAAAKLARAEGQLEKALEGETVKLDAAQKAQAAYSLIMKDSTTAQGDFARTSDGVANSSKIQAARLDDMRASMGERLIPVQQKLLEVGGDLLDWWDSLSSGTQDGIVKFGLFAAAAGPVIRIMGTLTGAAGKLVGGLAKVSRWMFVAGPDSASKFARAMSATKGAVVGAGRAIARGFALAMTGIRTAVTKTTAFLMANPWVLAIAAVIAITVLIIKNWDKVKRFLIAAWKAISKVATAVWGAIVKFFRGVWDGITRDIRRVWSWVTGYFRFVFNLYRRIFTTAWNVVRNIVTGAFNAVSSFIRRALNGWRRIITGTFNAVRTIASRAWSGFVSIITGALDRVWRGLKRIGGNILGWIRGLKDMVLSGVRGAASWLRGIGADIVRGLWNGISGMGGWLAGRISSFVADKVPGPIRKFLRIGSPSKLMAGIGEDTVAGLVVGIRGKEREAAAASRSLAHEVARTPIDLPLGDTRPAAGAGRFDAATWDQLGRAIARYIRKQGDIVVQAETNADPRAIGAEVAWALRTTR